MYLKVHPELAEAALTQRRDKGFVLWLLARALDGAGKGYVEKQRFVRALVQGGLYKESTLYRQMKHEALGVFWEEAPWMEHGVQTGVILRYKSVLRIAEQLGCQRLSAPQSVPVHAGRTLHERRANLFAVAWASPRGSRARPKSRAFLADRIQRVRSTQWRYEQTAGVGTVRNFAQENVEGVRVVPRQLPNIRRNHFERLRRGQSRKYRPKGLDTGTRLTSRRYFDSKEAAMRHLANRDRPGNAVYVLKDRPYALVGERSTLVWAVY